MKTVKVNKQYDHYVPGQSMTSYTPDGGDNKDGTYEVSDTVAEAMGKAGVIEGGSTSSGGSSSKGSTGTGDGAGSGTK